MACLKPAGAMPDKIGLIYVVQFTTKP